MEYSKLGCALSVIYLLGAGNAAIAQDTPGSDTPIAAATDITEARSAPPLYIIFDGSNSMWGELADKSRKIEVAKNVFHQLDAGLFKGREVALRLYGHRRAGDCADTELVVPFAPAATALARVSDQIRAVTPRGKTPISRSLRAALEDFDGRSGEILLISDGIETCDTDPCELVESWRDANVDIRVHVVGLGLNALSRGAMQCIADASGTTYRDANTAGELSQAIETAAASEPPPAGEPRPAPQRPRAEFKIRASDEDGNFVPVAGTISRADFEAEIANNFRYVFDAGQYTINVGVPTVNGTLYGPISKEVEVLQTGTTLVEVTIARPPMIRTRFVAEGEDVRGVVANVLVNGQEQFKLRPGDDYFIEPGSYDFRARLNKDNDLSVSETVVEGDDKEIIFTAEKTVRTSFKVRARGHDKPLRQHQQLWQDGELKYKVHVSNGADIRPGIYTLRSESPLTPYEITDVEVPPVHRQILEFEVPFGTIRPSYQFIEPPAKKGRRCWIYRVDAQGKDLVGSKAKSCDGTELVAIPGRYRIHTWSALGEFEDTRFEVITGQRTDVTVQQTAPP